MERIFSFGFYSEKFKKEKHLINYLVFGLISVSVDLAVFALLTRLLQIDYFFANIISVNCGIMTSFILNRKYNFRVYNKVIIRFVVFYLIGMIGLLCSTFLLYLLIEKLHIEKIQSKIATVFIVALLQFLLNKNITFKDKKNKSDA